LGSGLGAGVGAGVGAALAKAGAATGAGFVSAVGLLVVTLNKSSTSKCGESSFFSSAFGYSVNFYPAT
jgi:hypothetical protein